MIPSQMENKKKRIVAKDILDRKGDRFSNYVEEFEYLINSGITIASHAISNPKYPLAESQQKNLLKLYHERCRYAYFPVVSLQYPANTE